MPTDESTWSPRLIVYFKAVTQFHARRKDTTLGMLMVTNLSGFPSALTVVAVPDGDVRNHREAFILNENLKRLGCSGRAGLNLAPPTGATQAKFQLLYRTSDRIPLPVAVVELVKLCQVALMLFAKLAPEYADGLLCDVTERAINDWWTDLGTDFYNIEPSDGILGPTTVAALLGMLVGARNRLNAYGAPVAKDAFDIISLKRGIAYFQKSQKMERTRRLDRQTLDRLHKVTAKAASSEGWNVPRAVKSTVAELSGKGGEMAMGMVGAREKAGIAEVETMDLERFIELVHGERSKWLWFGKPLKSLGNDVYNNLGGDVGKIFSNDEQGGYMWSSKKRDSVADEGNSRRRHINNVYLRPANLSQTNIDTADNDQQSRKNVFKSVTGKMNDARGKIKDAVGISGLRGHHSKQPKEANTTREHTGHANQGGYNNSDTQLAPVRSASPSASVPFERSAAASAGEAPSNTQATTSEQSKGPNDVQDSNTRDIDQVGLSAKSKLYDVLSEESRRQDGAKSDPAGAWDGGGSVPQVDTAEPSIAGSIYRDSDYEDILPERDWTGKGVGSLLQRTQSFAHRTSQTRNESWWPRHLSFSTVEDAVLCWEDIGWNDTDTKLTELTPSDLGVLNGALAEDAKIMRTRILQLQDQIGAWSVNKIDEVEALDLQGSKDQGELTSIYHQRRSEFEALGHSTDELLAREKMSLREAVTDVELSAAKLEYELNALQSKVEEVEDGVDAFEQLVSDVEARTQELQVDHVSRESSFSWLLRFFTGARIRA